MSQLQTKNIFIVAPELIWQTQVQQTRANDKRLYQATTATKYPR
ncbi:hypothetical protein [Shewanella sp. SR44-3]|nr:hypothetical protein [Shewanella sp. SR44-3]